MSGFQNDPGVTQQEAGFGFNGRFWTESFTDGVTALAGGAQAGSPVMASMFNRISTVATAGDSVQLPPAGSIPGGCVCVFNNTAKSVTVFGANGSTDTINGTAGSTGITMIPQSICWYTTLPGINTGWLANGIGYGNYTAGQYPLTTFSTQTGITAHAGGGQGAAVQINAAQAQISVCATTGDSVKLPPSQPGLEITIVNNGANSANVFPATGEQINTSGANTAVALAVTTPVIYYCFVAGNWVTK